MHFTIINTVLHVVSPQLENDGFFNLNFRLYRISSLTKLQTLNTYRGLRLIFRPKIFPSPVKYLGEFLWMKQVSGVQRNFTHYIS